MASSRFVACTFVAAALVGCNLLPGPTPLVAEETWVEVAYENHTDDVYVISVVGSAPGQEGFATVEPCSVDTVSVLADPPFEIGLGLDAGPGPQPVIATSDDVGVAVDGFYRYFIRIRIDGVVQSGVSIGPPEFGVGFIC